jgi:hypothetical protein
MPIKPRQRLALRQDTDLAIICPQVRLIRDWS